ncbi:MAG: hypothetical protein Q9208_006501 [Pyrenodesmia sp. 3 TL-2023]
MASIDDEVTKLRKELAAFKASSAKDSAAKDQEIAAKNQEIAAQKKELGAQKKELGAANEELRDTTLAELLELCYKHLDLTFQVETDPAKSTQGSITHPKGKRCPHYLRPWIEFPALQFAAFTEIHQQVHPPMREPLRLFKNMNYIKELGKTFAKKMASEADLRSFLERAVENFVTEILQGLGRPIRFDNHSNTLGQDPEAFQERNEKYPYADQFCVYRNDGGQSKLLLVFEYKAPHKLTAEALRVALHHPDSKDSDRDSDDPDTAADSGEPDSIDVWRIKNKPRIPKDRQRLIRHKAKELLAYAATQTYHYMLESGCEYSAISTGEAMVFLWIKKEESSTLYYHLAEPVPEVRHCLEKSLPGDFPHSRTAIAQLLSFCVMAFKSTNRDQVWRQEAQASAPLWKIDYDKAFLKTPEELRALMDKADGKDWSFRPPEKLQFEPRQSPYALRKRSKKSTSNCQSPTTMSRDDPGSPDDDPQNSSDVYDTPTKPKAAKYSSRQQQPHTTSSSSSGKEQRRQYCTQACLLGLVQRLPIDEHCPNARLHPRGRKVNANKHALTAAKLCNLLRGQLARTLDKDCTDLRLQGARGMLFQLTLSSHGYTFVGKGTIDIYLPDLQHEYRMYQRMRQLQGVLIPVCLGNIDLSVPWHDLHIKIIHMLLLSYGGETISRACEVEHHQQVRRFELALADRGVKHEDTRRLNMLWNKELGKLMFIDFERSTVEIGTRALQDITPNRKRKRPSDADSTFDFSPISRQGSSPFVAHNASLTREDD